MRKFSLRKVEGAESKIDAEKQLIKDLVHLVRNAVVHVAIQGQGTDSDTKELIALRVLIHAKGKKTTKIR